MRQEHMALGAGI